ncbi:acyl-CoA carboxylase subunit epsilon [Pseudonocardia sp. ICBG1293]|uniref:acyl-CoA carboxylase subunit epsilon n=1 Tax=Pseudonocardia sp. ICBG1293 TaxID=2844382 RepID=UPI001CCCA403|nr:acyl-CoA carboxylase subunit epsilon [Pseudonocardia sp. ICBG1293]
MGEPQQTQESTEGTPEERRALFRVVRGTPDDHELAALAAVVAAAASTGGPSPAPRTPDLWSHPAARLRAPLHAGPGAWRASGLPR